METALVNTIETETEYQHRATFSPEDNKIRIYPAYRLDKEEYAKVKAAGFAWAPKQGIFFAPSWTPDREDLALEMAGEIEDEDTSLVDRAADRAERFEGYQEKRAMEAGMVHKNVQDLCDGIPLGQPILCGHHSERHARKHAEQIENGMRKAIRLWDTSEYWKQRAAGALQHAKYKELPAVRARRIKTIEAEIRKLKAEYTPKNPDQIINQQPWSCPICRETFCKVHPEAKTEVPHVFCGASRGGCWIQVSRLPKIEQANKRWIEHAENRLIYEKAMLDEQGAGDLIKPKARPKQLPLLNYKAPEGFIMIPDKWHRGEMKRFDQVEMTKEQYSRIYDDYRGTETVENSHRVRIAITRIAGQEYGRKDVCVFLTDSKVHDKPELVINTPTVNKIPATEAPTVDKNPEPEIKQNIEAMKETLRTGIKTVAVPQLFPTPPDLAERMVNFAEINPGDRVLEPSAGTGNIIDTILGLNVDCWIEIVEKNLSLVDVLASKYHKPVICGDFLEKTLFELGGKFDKIIMNPPFENGSDILHIKHALTFLKPGGRLVALCANGPRQQKELKPLAAYWEDLPEGTFKNAGTMVNTAMMMRDNQAIKPHTVDKI